MSVLMIDDATKLHVDGGPSTFNSGYTMCGWFKVPAANIGLEMDVLAIIANTFADTLELDALSIGGTTSQRLSGYAKAGGAYVVDTTGTTPILADTWYFMAYVRSTASAIAVYLGTETAACALEASGSASIAGRGLPLAVRAGGWTTGGGSDISARFASYGVKLWERVFTLAELQAEQFKAYPVIRTGLWSNHRLPSKADLRDYSGNHRYGVRLGAVDYRTSDDPAGVDFDPSTIAAAVSDESDSTFAISPVNPSGALLKLSLPDGTLGAGPVGVRIRHRKA